MRDYSAENYGAAYAAQYDGFYPPLQPNSDEIVALRRLAADGPVLELGVGTGRVAIPLAQQGLRVTGVDVSSEMLEKLRSKTRELPVQLHQADFSRKTFDERFSLIYAAFNTFFMLPDAASQGRALANAASMLSPTGRVVLEVFVPEPERFADSSLIVKRVTGRSVTLQASAHDVEAQKVSSQDILLSSEGIQLFPTEVRYMWPTELDAAARSAGLELEDRWGAWSGRQFEEGDKQQIAVYKLRD